MKSKTISHKTLLTLERVMQNFTKFVNSMLLKTIYNYQHTKIHFSELEDFINSDKIQDVTLADLKEKWRMKIECGSVKENVTLSDFETAL